MPRWIGACWPPFITALSNTTPTVDSAFDLERASASVTWPMSFVPLRRTTWPSCFTSCVVRAITWSPGLLCRASTAVSSVAWMALSFARFNDESPPLAEAPAELDADPEPEVEDCAELCFGDVPCFCCEADAEAEADAFALVCACADAAG